MIWVPDPGAGANDGHRYRACLRVLHDPELTESYGDAVERLEQFAANHGAALGEWDAHGPALSVYAQWAVYEMQARTLINDTAAVSRLQRLAQLQRRGGLAPAYPGIHRGRSSGWAAPPWWGGDIHAEHRRALIDIASERYSSDYFA